MQLLLVVPRAWVEMDSDSRLTSVTTVKAFLHRKWGEEPLEVRRFPLPDPRPFVFRDFVAKVASVFTAQLKEEEIMIHWKGRP